MHFLSRAARANEADKSKTRVRKHRRRAKAKRDRATRENAKKSNTRSENAGESKARIKRMSYINEGYEIHLIK